MENLPFWFLWILAIFSHIIPWYSLKSPLNHQCTFAPCSVATPWPHLLVGQRLRAALRTAAVLAKGSKTSKGRSGVLCPDLGTIWGPTGETCNELGRRNWPIPSGKHTKNYGKSPFFDGKINYKWPFSIAMLVYQRVVWCFGTSVPLLPNQDEILMRCTWL